MSVSAQVTICIHSLHIVGTVCLHVGDVLSRDLRYICFCVYAPEASHMDAFQEIWPSESLP